MFLFFNGIWRFVVCGLWFVVGCGGSLEVKESTSEPETQFSVVDAGGHGKVEVGVGFYKQCMETFGFSFTRQ
jgi:hypothetical protein